MSMEGAPIVQVAVEPTEVGMLQELERGLALLDQADPSVEVHGLPPVPQHDAGRLWRCSEVAATASLTVYALSAGGAALER